MLVFWIAAAVLTGAVLLALIVPLFRTRAAPEAEKAALAVYRDQIAEIDRDVARGLLDPALADGARAEAARRLLAAAKETADADADGGAVAGTDSGQPVGTPASTRRGIRMAVVLALVVPALSLGGYAWIGHPDLPAQPLASRLDGGPSDATQSRDMLDLVARLARRLEQTPDDLQGWRLLAQSYQQLGRFDQAVQAWGRAVALSEGAAWATGGLAEALILNANGRVPPEAVRAFQAILAEQPNDPRALFYLAEAELQAGRPESALEGWQTLTASSPADAPWLPQVRQRILAMAERLGRDPADVLPEPLPAEGSAAAPGGAGAGPGGGGDGTGADGSGGVQPPRGPNADDMAAAEALSPEQRRIMIEGMVEGLAIRLEADPSDVDGWLRLSRSYDVLGRPEEAEKALAEAAKRAADRPDVLQLYARRLMGDLLRQPDSSDPLPEAAIAAYRDLLAAAPEHPEALWFLGLDAANRGNPEDARRRWTALVAALDDNPRAAAAVQARLDRLPD